MGPDRRWTTWLTGLCLALAAVLVVDAALQGRWVFVCAAVLLLLSMAGSRRAGRRQAGAAQVSTAAAAEWSPERVGEVVGHAGGRHVAAVKALREADPRLSLLDADRLVRERSSA